MEARDPGLDDLANYMSAGARVGQHAGGAFAGYAVGQVVGAVGARLERRTTQPPPPYSQDSLLDAMVNAAQFARDDKERAILARCDGLGTSRTRVPMIEALIERGLLITRQAGRLWEIRISPLGYQLLEDVPEELRSVAMTARWEIALGGIREGRYEPADVIAKGYELVKRLVEHIRNKKVQRDQARAAAAAAAGAGGAGGVGGMGGAGPARPRASTTSGPGGSLGASKSGGNAAAGSGGGMGFAGMAAVGAAR